jgi:hypothetical protein
MQAKVFPISWIMQCMNNFIPINLMWVTSIVHKHTTAHSEQVLPQANISVPLNSTDHIHKFKSILNHTKTSLCIMKIYITNLQSCFYCCNPETYTKEGWAHFKTTSTTDKNFLENQSHPFSNKVWHFRNLMFLQSSGNSVL